MKTLLISLASAMFAFGVPSSALAGQPYSSAPKHYGTATPWSPDHRMYRRHDDRFGHREVRWHPAGGSPRYIAGDDYGAPQSSYADQSYDAPRTYEAPLTYAAPVPGYRAACPPPVMVPVRMVTVTSTVLVATYTTTVTTYAVPFRPW